MEDNDEMLTRLLTQDINMHFEQLVLAYQDRLYAFALSRVRNAHAAEEVVLLALERAYYALKGYPPQRISLLKLGAWLFEITRNIASNYLRDLRARENRLPSISLDTTEASFGAYLEDPDITPEEVACYNEDRQELEQGIKQLPTNYQTAIQLYYFEHCSAREIADRIGQPVGTVKSNIHRGTKLLHQLLNTHIREVR
ncbi:RNA polymerase sigma-H factor [Dictyobacter alpinus]|uniref:RNA polymerase sigma-H factor n=1 Tax=Dictyobacter alpinus TaxID=2014873 RepID=A0A402B2V0_9CHLR|nr:sigma-70 family RNA polymerase sigma factor [Dictyobacter alpinus]GCE25676.1 RNA polymerase sigma-H factor [Dictyobacter alpinus]